MGEDGFVPELLYYPEGYPNGITWSKLMALGQSKTNLLLDKNYLLDSILCRRALCDKKTGNEFFVRYDKAANPPEFRVSYIKNFCHGKPSEEAPKVIYQGKPDDFIERNLE